MITIFKRIISKIFIRLIDKNYLSIQLNNSSIKPYLIIGKEQNVKIGRSVSFGGNVVLHAGSKISIGDATMIGYGTIVHTSTHNPEMQPAWREWIRKPISIGANVWIGTGVIILPGVVIEDSAIIGAGSVVTKNVPKGAIIAGNPARILKYRNFDVIDQKYDLESVQSKTIDSDFLEKYLMKE
ncbi:MAG: acyltransferase [Cyclobacteriaceae bacterium]|jgi:acetyltransferase-like isoleucine patch superfamily enzyme